MKFKTEFIAEKGKFSLNPTQPVILAGSCFTQNIALKMNSCQWSTFNPFGTLYNPESIIEAFTIMLDTDSGRDRFEKSLFENGGLWYSNLFDSSFASLQRNDCVTEFTARQKRLISTITHSCALIITFGTSICYFLKETSNAVGNCHKRSAELFQSRRLTLDEIVRKWNLFVFFLSSRYPDLKIIFTVSPVRHLKNGFTGNSLSKAVLQLALEEICAPNDNCHYFPAYEIMNDDLRDYRFYASDLLHPSEQAVDYIWEKFQDTYLDEAGKKKLKEGEKKYKQSHHRPLTGALGQPLSKH